MKRLMFLTIGAAAMAFAAPAVAKPKHAKHQGHGAYGAWGNSCPPGLAKKNNGCRPPGQAKKLYNIGQRWPGNYGSAWSYNQIPYDWRNRYDLDPSDRYYYGDGYLYRVDPRTMMIEQVLSALLR